MKLTIINILILVLFSGCSESKLLKKSKQVINTNQIKDYNKCDMNIILSINNNLNTLDSIHVYKLFYTIDSNCSNNVEFSEFSNEILFKVLEKRPKLFFIELDRIKNEVNYEYILNELKNPIHDRIEISKILINIEKTELENPSKNKIIQILMNIKK